MIYSRIEIKYWFNHSIPWIVDHMGNIRLISEDQNAVVHVKLPVLSKYNKSNSLMSYEEINVWSFE